MTQITELHNDTVQAEPYAELLERVRWLAQFPNENPNPVFRVDAQGVIVYANLASAPLLNYWQSGLNKKLPASLCVHVGNALQTHQHQQAEVVVEDTVFDLAFAPTADATYVNIYGFDITGRKRTELALRENEAVTRMLFDTAPMGIIVVDACGCIVRLNYHAIELFGYSMEQLINRPLSLLIPEDTRLIHQKHCSGYFEHPHNRMMGSGLDLYARRKDGSIFPVEISLASVDTQQGKLVTAFIIDITQQKETEQLRDTMIQTMVHDLRNPLGNIMTSIEIMKMDMNAGSATELTNLLGIAGRGVNKMLHLVNNILDVSRLESGKMPLELGGYPFYILVDDVISNLMPQAHTKAILVESLVSSSLPKVWVDGPLISRVLQNLIGNAIKFTPEEGSIRVTARVDADNSDKILVSVSDTGEGIPLEVQTRLFGKFITGGSLQSGSGLGLAFCKLVLEAHGETIAVRSQVGEGTTFTFSLGMANSA